MINFVPHPLVLHDSRNAELPNLPKVRTFGFWFLEVKGICVGGKWGRVG